MRVWAAGDWLLGPHCHFSRSKAVRLSVCDEVEWSGGAKATLLRITHEHIQQAAGQRSADHTAGWLGRKHWGRVCAQAFAGQFKVLGCNNSQYKITTTTPCY